MFLISKDKSKYNIKHIIKCDKKKKNSGSDQMNNNNTETYIIVFSSSNYSMKLYKLLKEKKYKVEMISTPCTLSAGCSRALRVRKKDIVAIKEVIKREKIVIRAIYEKIINGRKIYYKKK